MLDIKETSLVHQIYNIMERAILSGEILTGQELKTAELSRELGINTGVIKDALVMLEKERIVEFRNGEYYAVGITLKDIEEMYNVRSFVEEIAFVMASKNIDENELLKLNRIIEAQRRALEEGNNNDVRNLDTEFHNFIYELSGSMTYRMVLTEIHRRMSKLRTQSIGTTGRGQASVDEHAAILSALDSGDEIAIKHAVNAHLYNSYASIKEKLMSK